MVDVISEMGRLIGDPTRARMLDLMMNGTAFTVGELARFARVSVSSASEQLGKLREGGLVTCQASGRHRYYRLAGPEVADLLETITGHPSVMTPARIVRTPPELRHARSCYDHLAGAVAVAVFDLIVTAGSEPAQVSVGGMHSLRLLGLDGHLQAAGGAPVIRPCMDWSERRSHLAGPLGRAFLATLLEKRWLVPRPTPRALTVTRTGRENLTAVLGEHQAWTALSPSAAP